MLSHPSKQIFSKRSIKSHRPESFSFTFQLRRGRPKVEVVAKFPVPRMPWSLLEDSSFLELHRKFISSTLILLIQALLMQSKLPAQLPYHWTHGLSILAPIWAYL